jgi:hypothetical protein
MTCGPDGIPNIFLKRMALYIAEGLKAIYNVSFREGTLPADWKIASVSPIPKKSHSPFLKDHRPVL